MFRGIRHFWVENVNDEVQHPGMGDAEIAKTLQGDTDTIASIRIKVSGVDYPNVSEIELQKWLMKIAPTLNFEKSDDSRMLGNYFTLFQWELTTRHLRETRKTANSALLVSALAMLIAAMGLVVSLCK